eukprot:2147549-Pleurochrysis_carterae.AAC.1
MLYTLLRPHAYTHTRPLFAPILNDSTSRRCATRLGHVAHWKLLKGSKFYQPCFLSCPNARTSPTVRHFCLPAAILVRICRSDIQPAEFAVKVSDKMASFVASYQIDPTICVALAHTGPNEPCAPAPGMETSSRTAA